MFLKILLILFLLFVIFLLATRKYREYYPLILLFGQKGSGKTTTLTQYAIKYMKRGVKVYANFVIPGAYFFDPKRLGEFSPEPGSLLLIDEIALVWDARNWQNFASSKFFKLQRRCKCVCIAATQVFDDFDKRIRDLVDEMWMLSKPLFGVISIRRRVIKRVRPTEDQADIRGHYQFAGLIGGLKFAYIPRYVEYFDSYETPDFRTLASTPYPMSKSQIAHISTKKWMVDVIIGKFAGIGERLKNGFDKIRSGLAAKLNSRRGSDKR